MNYFIGIDIGSQSSKGVLVDEYGQVISKHSISHTMDSPKLGHFEQDADKTWWQEFCDICKVLIKESKVDKNDIKVVSHSATSPCVVFLDAHNKVLRKAILYGIDTRASKEIQYLTDTIGLDNLINTGGCPLSSQSVAPKILWVKNNEPEVFNNTRKILSSNGYITYKLTGLYTLNNYDAVGYTGLFDIFKKEWIDAYSEHIIPLQYLPNLVSPSSFVGGVNKAGAIDTGLSEGTLVMPGIADAAADSLSAGSLEKGDMMLMLGTSSFFIVLTDKLYKTNKFWPSNFLFDNQYVVTGGTSNCGSAIVWFMNTFMNGCLEESVYDTLLNEARANNLSTSSPICVPYFAGERTPIHDTGAKAMFFGLALGHSRGQLYNALLEGIAYSIKYNIDEIKKITSINNIYAIGGGVKNPLLMGLLSDICQTSIYISDMDASSAFGDALFAIKCYNPNVSIKDFIKTKKQIYPKSDNKKLVEKRYDTFQKLYISTRDLLE